MQVRDLLGGPQRSWNDNIKMDINGKWKYGLDLSGFV